MVKSRRCVPATQTPDPPGHRVSCPPCGWKDPAVKGSLCLVCVNKEVRLRSCVGDTEVAHDALGKQTLPSPSYPRASCTLVYSSRWRASAYRRAHLAPWLFSYRFGDSLLSHEPCPQKLVGRLTAVLKKRNELGARRLSAGCGVKQPSHYW